MTTVWLHMFILGWLLTINLIISSATTLHHEYTITKYNDSKVLTGSHPQAKQIDTHTVIMKDGSKAEVVFWADGTSNIDQTKFCPKCVECELPLCPDPPPPLPCDCSQSTQTNDEINQLNEAKQCDDVIVLFTLTDQFKQYLQHNDKSHTESNQDSKIKSSTEHDHGIHQSSSSSSDDSAPHHVTQHDHDSVTAHYGDDSNEHDDDALPPPATDSLHAAVEELDETVYPKKSNPDSNEQISTKHQHHVSYREVDEVIDGLHGRADESVFDIKHPDHDPQPPLRTDSLDEAVEELDEAVNPKTNHDAFDKKSRSNDGVSSSSSSSTKVHDNDQQPPPAADSLDEAIEGLDAEVNGNTKHDAVDKKSTASNDLSSSTSSSSSSSSSSDEER